MTEEKEFFILPPNEKKQVESSSSFLLDRFKSTGKKEAEAIKK